MKRVVFFISVLAVCSAMYCFSSSKQSVHDPNDTIGINDTIPSVFTSIVGLEIPEIKPNEKIVLHTGFSLVYNDGHKQADWVAYMLCKKRTIKVCERPNMKFKVDPAVKTGTATHEDYTNSKHDRGHLAPCRDMQWSCETTLESFFMSNISPQVPNFNRGVWEKLEDLVRDWAIEYDTLYIVTGPVLKKEIIGVIGDKTKISVPKYYYKVILNYTSNRIKGIGFIMPNEASNKPLQYYAVSIDSVQRFTGINFYNKLPNTLEKQVESSLCVSCWIWSKK